MKKVCFLLLTGSFCNAAIAQNKADSLKNDHPKKQSIYAISADRNFSFAPLPTNYATQKLPFFCRQENKLEKITKIPFRLRVGDVSDCNYLEQKPGYKIR